MNFNWALLGLLNPFEEGSKKQRIVLIVALVGVLGGGCWWLADTGFGKASGLAETKYRIEMMGKALFWEYRANMGKTVAGEVGQTFRGYIDKGQKSYLLVYLYDGQGRRRQVVTLANVNNETVELTDRKSTRLNSSHSQTSYAVFCLKKEKILLFMAALPTVLSARAAEHPPAAAK